MTFWLAVVVFVGVFWFLQSGGMQRHLVMVTGAVVMVVVGGLGGFYTPVMALKAVQVDTLALIFGLSMISATLAKSGWFALVAVRMARYVHGNGWFVLVLFSLVTYAVSLVVNNLAAMIVILPVTLPVCRANRINPVPVVIAEIVASNLGGASTMIGDFPNMIIASVAHLHFVDFIAGMMVPCLILLAVMLLYFYKFRYSLAVPGGKIASDKEMIQEIQGDGAVRWNDRLYGLGMTALLFALIGFLCAGWLGWRPAWIALVVGFFLILAGEFSSEELPGAMGMEDILFFAGLFVLVGGLHAAGVLNKVSLLISGLGGQSAMGRMLAMMWLAGLFTLFLNAGPTTALFLPIAGEMSTMMAGSSSMVWWSLSLGVLAGSSGTLTGATAGAVAASAVDRYLQQHPAWARLLPDQQGLTFRAHLAHGLPIMLIFLGFSSFYLWLSGPA